MNSEIMVTVAHFHWMIYSFRVTLGAGMSARIKILLGGIVVAAALVWLGFVGFQESKAYYITVDEYSSMQGDA